MADNPQPQKLTIKQAISKAKQAAEQGNNALAIKIYMGVLTHQPNNADAKKALHIILAKPSNPPQNQINALIDLYNTGLLSKTEEACRELLKTYPQASFVINLLGVISTTQMKFDEAVRLLERAIQLKPSYAEAYLNLASALKELGRPQDAVKKCRKAIQLNPDFAEAHCVLGTALKELEQTREAIRSYKKAIQLKPGFSEAYVGLGDIYLKQGIMDKGLRMQRRANHVICFDFNDGVSILRGN